MLRLAIHTHDLLAVSVRLAGKDASFGDRGIVFQLNDAARREVLLAETMHQFVAAFVVTYDADREHVHA